MITIEKLENFGVIKEAKEPIEIKPLTIFMGDNSSGKSYLAMLVYGILKRSFDTDKEIENVYDLFKDKTFIIKLYNLFGKIIDKNISNTTLTISPKEQEEVSSILNYIIEKNINEIANYLFSMQMKIDNFKLNGDIAKYIDKLNIKYDYKDGYGFEFLINNDNIGGSFSDSSMKKNDELIMIIDYLIYILNHITRKNIIYLPASRTGFMQTYKNLGSRAIQGFYSNDFEMQERQILNTPTRYFLDKLSFPKNYEDNRITSFIEKEILRGEVLLDKDSNDIEFKLSSGEILPLHTLSSTITELMPLVIFLKRGYIKKDTLLIIEEPEAHLSFKNQRLMAKIIAMLLSEGVKVLITTHSDFLVYEINNLIKKDTILKNSELKNKILKDEDFEENNKIDILNELENIEKEKITINYENVGIYNFLLSDDGKSVVSRVKVDNEGIENKYIFDETFKVTKEKNTLYDILDYINANS